jgi:hypothetical protein
MKAWGCCIIEVVGGCWGIRVIRVTRVVGGWCSIRVIGVIRVITVIY